MSALEYTSTHQVLYYECEKTKRLTLPMLLNILIQVSGEQSAHLGLGDDKMEEMGYAWIVLQHTFEVTRMPQTNETIQIMTKARQYNKFFCYRDFFVRGEQGENLVTFTMVFAILDRNQRKMVRIPKELVEPYGAPFEKGLVRIPKPTVLDEKDAASALYRVRYFDIDGNDHVNNSKYIEWMLDMLGAEFLASHELKSGTIKFEKELVYGQMVNCLASLSEKDGAQSSHRIQTDNQIHCTASFEWH